MNKLTLVFLGFVLVLPQQLAAAGAVSFSTGNEPDELTLPAVPDTLRTPRERAGYVLLHFWDNLDFRDTLRSRDTAFVEQNFVNYLSVFSVADSADVAAAVTALLRRAEADAAAYGLVASLAEKYLYETASPLYDENHYLHFLDVLAFSPWVGATGRARYAARRDAARLNRVGSVAADFAYVDADGVRHTLHTTEAPALLVIFYDPECEHCEEMMATLRGDAALGRLVADGRLRVLAVFADGVAEEWRHDMIPAAWIDALDATGVQECGRYVLRSLPGLYWLDGDKRVLLNTPAAILSRLRENTYK